MTESNGEPGGERSWRDRTVVGLLILTFVSAVLGGPVVYGSYVVRDEDRFVDLADRVIDHPEVRSALADQIVEIAFAAIAADEVVADLLPVAARQLAAPVTRLATVQLTGVAFDAIDTDVAVRARDAALREVHRQIVESDDPTVTIDLRAVIVRVAREFGGPTVGSAIAAVASTQDIGRFEISREGSGSGALVSFVRRLPDLGALVAGVTLASFVLAIVVAADRRRTLIRGGLCIAAGALVSTVVVSVVLSALLNVGDDAALGDLGPALSEVLSADFAARQRGPMVAGIVIALVGVVLGRSRSAIALRSLPRQLWRHDMRGAADSAVTVLGGNPAFARVLLWTMGSVILLSWPTPTVRVMVAIPLLTIAAQVVVWRASAMRPRGTNLVVVALLAFLLWPAWSRSLVLGFTIAVGLALAVCELPGARRHARAHCSDPAVPDGGPAERDRRRPAVVGAAMASIAAVMIGGVAVSAASGAGGGRSASAGCNGHEELCGRRIDEVTFAGSHNSMSSKDLGWDLALQEGDIVSQLDAGVRALLLDTHYWGRDGTVEGGDDPAARVVIEDALDDDRPQPGLWLCHGFCALGATPLDGALAEIDTWLDENPREVLIMIVQDEISTADTMTAFTGSGLIDRVHEHVPGTPWPTLRSLIDSDRRLLVYAENEGRPDSWYQNGYDTAFTETPYSFAVRSDFSCAPNRGRPDNPLLLINHWITSGIPVVEAAVATNSADTLRARIEQCRTERGRDPTIVAVDFAEVGDLIRVVDETNGVAG